MLQFLFLCLSLSINISALNLTNSTKCPGKNSYRDSKGKCKCKPNYFGDPDKKSVGCWTCNPKCHKDAICKSRSQCMCNGGYFGDGIISCKPISFLPVIESVYPSFGRSHSTNDYISIKLKSKIPDNSSAYAKFSDFVVECNTSIYTLHCKLPWLIASNTSLRVSFNGNDWSRKEWNFVFVDSPEEIKTHLFIFFIPASFLVYLIINEFSCHKKKQKTIQSSKDTSRNYQMKHRRLSASSTSTYGDENDSSFEL